MRVLMFAAILLAAACAASEENPGEEARATRAPAATGEMCGGIVGIQCAAAEDYCYMEPGLCRSTMDAAGVCQAKPEACTMEYAPVCGCDGKTYGNACGAAAAGVSVASAGECQDTEL